MDGVVDNPALRGRKHVFLDRDSAGRALALALRKYVEGDAVLLPIPYGGVPVAAAVSVELGWPMEPLIIRKLQIPSEPEAGFGAVAMDGSRILNDRLVEELGLSEKDIERATDKAMARGRSQEEALGIHGRSIAVRGRLVVIVDDGLASGYSMLAAIRQVRTKGAEAVVVAVPTGSESAVELVSDESDLLICLNMRRGPFAVADAYHRWHDISEEEAMALIQGGQ